MKKKLFRILLMFLIFTYILPISVLAKEYSNDSEMREYYDGEMRERNYTAVKAIVRNITYDDTNEVRDTPIEADIRYQHLEIEILNGKYKGERMKLRHTVERIMPGYYVFKKGDRILLRLTEEDGKIATVKIEERVRDRALYMIIGLFMLLVIIFAGYSGLKALVSLAVTLMMIICLYVPMIIKGYNPIFSSIAISVLATVITLLIISGLNIKTLVAVTGTITGLIMAGVLSMVFGHFTYLTGLSDENAINLAFIPQFRDLDYRGLLFGTMLIGALGAIMDVAVSISSSLYEIYMHNPSISFKEMAHSGMNIGKDILSSMSNTLILAYVGTSLHIIILFVVYRVYPVEIINLDSVASEIVRAMAGSIGLIASIPASVLMASYCYRKYIK